MRTEPIPVAASCTDLVKVYRTSTGEVRALRGVTASFAASALSVVAGPSGSGKSSLLRILAGLDRPTSGAARIGGMALAGARSRSLRSARRHVVGYVFQRPSDNFFPQLTVGQHLRLAMERAPGFGRARAAHSNLAPDEVVDLLGIADRLDHHPAELSGGEQQRAAFAQVLFTGARIVVADEPTAELDGVSASHMLDAIDALVGEGVSFIVASHDADVMRRAHEVLRIEDGIAAGAGAGAGRDPGAKRPAWEASGSFRDVATAPPVVEERPVVVEARGLVKTYHRGGEAIHAVRDVDLRLLEGELVGLFGRSGSGKTTLLNVIAGWERADAGTVELGDGRRVDPRTPWSELAVLPQKLGLIEEFTIRENIEYPARLGRVLAEVAWLTDELIDDLGLRQLEHRYPRETSVGEQQRAALARGLVLSPTLVLADEPTSHQDLQRTQDVLSAVRRAVARGTACLAATHNEALVRHLDRVLAMDDGRLSERAGSIRRVLPVGEERVLVQLREHDRLGVVCEGRVLAEARTTDRRAAYASVAGRALRHEAVTHQAVHAPILGPRRPPGHPTEAASCPAVYPVTLHGSNAQPSSKTPTSLGTEPKSQSWTRCRRRR